MTTTAPAVARRPGSGSTAVQPSLVTGVGLGVVAVVATAIAWSAAARAPIPVPSDLGLVAVLPAAYWAGPATLSIVFALVVPAAARHRWLLALLLGCLVLTLYSPAVLASEAPRLEVTWRHLGIIDVITRTGTINPKIDAYFNWPGFFGAVGLLTGATGISPWDLALWAPVGNMLLWFVALATLARGLTTDPRVVWTTLWLFCLGNWIDQDYLSPQAFAFFLHILILNLLTTWLGAQPQVDLSAAVKADGLLTGVRRWWTSRTPTEADPRRRTAGLFLCVLLSAVMIVSHQLTPFAVVVSATALVVVGRCWSARLPVILSVLTMAWLTYGASAYLAGHPVLFASAPGAAANADLVERLDGGPGHLVVVLVRIALTATLWGLAAVGLVRRLRSGERDLRPVLLAVAPVVLLPVQSYGGEMLLRVSLFALPFIAFLAAHALIGRPGRSRRADLGTTVAIAVVGLALAPAMVTGRFGNARFDTFTPTEIEAGAALYQVAPPNALLLAGAHPTPWRFEEYTRKYTTIQDICRPSDRADECFTKLRARMRHDEDGAAILFSRSNEESLRLQGLMTPATFEQVEAMLRAESGTRLVYANADSRIYLIPARVRR